MTPYYKLPKDWYKKNEHVTFIGPEGLISHHLIDQFCTHHNIKRKSHLISSTADCQDLRAKLATQSLFSEPEIWLIRLAQDKLLPTLNLPNQHPEKKFIVYGCEKKPKNLEKTTSQLLVQTYYMKEPYASTMIQSIALEKGINISTRAAKWINLCYQGHESLIPSFLEKTKMVYNTQSVSDEQIKPLLSASGLLTPFDMIQFLSDGPEKISVYFKSIQDTQWAGIYWSIAQHWRKLLQCKENPQQLKTHFPWPNQQKTANTHLNCYTYADLSKHLNELITLEVSLKGFG